LIESMIVVAIVLATSAIALPMLNSTRRAYRMSQATANLGGIIEATRYKAIMTGCPFALALDQTTRNYQISTQVLTGTPPACAGAMTNVGNPIPWAASSDMSMTPSTTLQFTPNGVVTATTGSLTFTVSNGYTTSTITVSGVGNVKITGH
jgi:Tfp pilus assembly protein FimT